MKKFIIITNEGSAYTPEGENIENAQVLAFIDAKNEAEAHQKLLTEHDAELEAFNNDYTIYEIK